jgi:zona occludens toxin (predicted ATPase)
MNERVPDSTGLPLRAMVMVLLFLGVIFLLVGFQAMGSGANTDDDSSGSTVTTSTMAPKTSAKPAAAPVKADVRVYNVSGQDGIATRTANQLKQGGYNVTEIGDMPLRGVSKTTVYFTDAPGEHETADAVGQLLKAPVAARIPEVADKPPGVIVLVVG